MVSGENPERGMTPSGRRRGKRGSGPCWLSFELRGIHEAGLALWSSHGGNWDRIGTVRDTRLWRFPLFDEHGGLEELIYLSALFWDEGSDCACMEGMEKKISEENAGDSHWISESRLQKDNSVRIEGVSAIPGWSRSLFLENNVTRAMMIKRAELNSCFMICYRANELEGL